MAIIIDRKYMEVLADVLENKRYIDEDVKEQMVKQARRLVQIEKSKESGFLNGRPKKTEIDKETEIAVEEYHNPKIKFCEFLLLVGPVGGRKKSRKKENVKEHQLIIDFNF